jgi:hypothetical protein
MKKVKANIYGRDVEPKKGVNNQYRTPPNAISQPCLMMASGVRNSGKSYAVSKIVAQAQKTSTFDEIYICTPTMLSNMAYFGKFIPSINVFEPTGDCINKVLERGEENKNEWEDFCQELMEWKEYMTTLKGSNDFTDEQLYRFDDKGYLDGIVPRPVWKYKTERPPQSLVILDDILGSESIMKSSGLTKCATLNRHLFPINPEYVGNGRTACGLSVIICSQVYRCQNGISKILRENLTHLMLVGKNKQPKQLDALTEELGGGIEPAKFMRAYEQATKERYGNLILDFFPECPTKQFRMNLDTYLVFAEDESECMCKKKPRQLRIKEEKVEEEKDKADKTSV